MTNDTDTIPRFTVYMHPLLERELDRKYSLINEMNREALYDELPRQHPIEPDRRLRRRLSKQTRVFRGWFHMSNSGFTYVQAGDRLHVVEFWFDGNLLDKRRRPAVDVVIGRRV
jgi:hypothetical protein